MSGTIDDAGQYSVAAPGTPLKASYGVAQVAGEWRISSLPNGLVLTPGDIDRGYRTFNLYYFTRDFSTLVPDPVTVPLSGSGLPTQLVRGLLAGATSWLAPAVRTAFPEGTRLALDSVPVRDGVAEVALTDEVLTADDATRQALSAQLVWTLRQLPDVTGVRMSVGGQTVSVPGVGPVQPVDSWATYDPDVLPDAALAYAAEPRGLVSIDVEGAIAVVGKSRPEILRPAVSLDSTRVAGVGADGASLWEARLGADQTASRRYVGTDLSTPSWDRLGAIWFVDRGRGLVRVRNGVATVVPVMGLPKGVREVDLTAVAVSRDGTRMALLVRRGTRVEPLVARLENTAESVRVSAPQRIESVITEAVDLAWQDADTLARPRSLGRLVARGRGAGRRLLPRTPRRRSGGCGHHRRGPGSRDPRRHGAGPLPQRRQHLDPPGRRHRPHLPRLTDDVCSAAARGSAGPASRGQACLAAR